MNPIPPRSRSRGIPFAFALAILSIACIPKAHAYGKAEPAAAPAPIELPPPPPSEAMQDKFRKLQKEMESAAHGPASASAAKSAKTADNQPADTVSVGGVALQIAFGLIFVVLLAVVTIRVLKRLQGRMLSKPGRSGDIFEVLETCHLGSQQRIVALRMNEEVGIVGVTQHGISLLTMLKEPADDLRRSRESNSAAFSDNLNKLLERFKKPKKVSDLLDEGAA